MKKKKEQAKALYLSKTKPVEIAKIINVGVRTVRNWIKNGEWDSILVGESLELATTRRMNALIAIEEKTSKQYTELDKLGDLLLKIAKIDKVKAETKIVLDNEPSSSGGKNSGSSKKRGSHKKNSVEHITKERLDEVAKELLKEYQLEIRTHKYDKAVGRKRFYLKSRQIGLTFYFAWEAFENAVLTGKSQAFISASLAQAEIFKAYITMFASKYFDVELTGGKKIKLSNGATFYFCSTNPNTVQGINGNLYYDEVFWTSGWDKLSLVSAPIASHKDKDICYFSTPSVTNHEAYPVWSGDKYNSTRTKKAVFDLSHRTLKNGDKGKDGMFRQMITIDDAIAKGCDFFDLEELKSDYSESQFNNLFRCMFIDHSNSIFNIDSISECHADLSSFKDYDSSKKKPFGSKAVWIGYDPSRFRDVACMVIVAPPSNEKGATANQKKFRVLEIHRFKKHVADAQAEEIIKQFKRFNVEYVGIDVTGFGIGVYDSVKASKDKPINVKPIHYSNEVKNQLVYKAQTVVNKQRLAFDPKEQRLTQSFMGVSQTATNNGNITYKSKRDGDTGHGDEFWSLTHVFYNEGIGKENTNRKTTVSI